jgi:hypothetical protein
MFPVDEAFGTALDAEYAANRARWEPLYELTQTKGDGEAHPMLSPDDALADFETWDKGNLDGSVPRRPTCCSSNTPARRSRTASC